MSIIDKIKSLFGKKDAALAAPAPAPTTQKRNENIIEIKGITKVFDGVTVLDDLNLGIKRGQFVTLLGPSGCGKTTLLRLIAGFETPTEGEIYIEGTPITSIPPFKRPVNTVFQKYALFPHLNVFKNVAFGLKLKTIPDPTAKKGVRKFTKEEIADKVNRALKLVGLEDYGHRDVNSLSGGQQQRVAIARAIVCEPKVLLLDEPLGALDLKMRKEMQIELKKMHEDLGITFIFVTHDQEEALTMSDVVVVMNDGVIQQIDRPKKIYDEPKNAFVADFIGESNLLPGVMEKDYKIAFLGKSLACVDKGFEKNEKVDVVIRPEDIVIKAGAGKGDFDGEVLTTVFKGTYYEMIVLASGYEFTVQSQVEHRPGETVSLGIVPDSIHIMKKILTINKYLGKVADENLVTFLGGDFEVPTEGFEIGDEVVVYVPFDAVELTDDEEDGVIGATVTQSIYKGSYYQVQVYNDNDEDLYVDTADEWDMNDRVGVKVDGAKVRLERYAPDADEEETE
ncbi:MAG: ABC transporter ATP-binding protein [Clostridia bacterium]|nr:ABC transporter ATP-binding protein [Clostridia bacterium]